MLDWNEYNRWMKSALATLESAKRDEDFNWACFKAEQATQLAVKAYLILVGKSYLVHDLATLLRNTELQLDKEILQCANFLTRVYIPSDIQMHCQKVFLLMKYMTRKISKKLLNVLQKLLIWLKKLEKILEERRKERERVIKEVKEFAEEVKKKLGKVTVVLYGSYARGDFNLWSDVDILLISDSFEGVRFLDRYEMFEPKERFEVKPYTYSEFLKMKDKIGWKEALKDKIVIIDDYNLFQ